MLDAALATRCVAALWPRHTAVPPPSIAATIDVVSDVPLRVMPKTKTAERGVGATHEEEPTAAPMARASRNRLHLAFGQGW